uniref:Uncharacterized protein n=1 Tax=Timema bartmani TaxID=61472 RepID=A0A7R9I0H1_9NEOP|nr:unnamed protein product [Timema bartmani]
MDRKTFTVKIEPEEDLDYHLHHVELENKSEIDCRIKPEECLEEEVHDYQQPEFILLPSIKEELPLTSVEKKAYLDAKIVMINWMKKYPHFHVKVIAVIAHVHYEQVLVLDEALVDEDTYPDLQIADLQTAIEQLARELEKVRAENVKLEAAQKNRSDSEPIPLIEWHYRSRLGVNFISDRMELELKTRSSKGSHSRGLRVDGVQQIAGGSRQPYSLSTRMALTEIKEIPDYMSVRLCFFAHLLLTGIPRRPGGDTHVLIVMVSSIFYRYWSSFLLRRYPSDELQSVNLGVPRYILILTSKLGKINNGMVGRIIVANPLTLSPPSWEPIDQKLFQDCWPCPDQSLASCLHLSWFQLGFNPTSTSLLEYRGTPLGGEIRANTGIYRQETRIGVLEIESFDNLDYIIHEKVLKIDLLNTLLAFCWIPGHAGLSINELAAKEAVCLAPEAGLGSMFLDLKSYVRREVLRTCHEHWVWTTVQSKLQSTRDGVSRNIKKT